MSVLSEKNMQIKRKKKPTKESDIFAKQSLHGP